MALVGSSGAGKTTLCNLIPRFYEATSGKITIDGKDIKDIKLKDLRDNIGIVQQDVYLFVGTVYDNIRYGRPDATREEVIAAAKEANAYDFIMSLPKGYDTMLAELGDSISGGERQRIGLTRAFLHNGNIILLDEPTSNIDSLNESVILNSIKKESNGKTIILVSHRKSTMGIADEVVQF